MRNLEKQTYADLLAKAKEVGLGCTEGRRPTKAVLLIELEQYFDSNPQDPSFMVLTSEDKPDTEEIEEVISEQPEVSDEQESKPSKPKTKQSSKLQLLRADLYRKERVIVDDRQSNQTKEEMISVSWGNSKIGNETDFVNLTGLPQYVRRGALNNLREATYFEHVPQEDGSHKAVRRKRFDIKELPPMTDEELEDLKQKQAVRNSSV